MKLVRMLTIAGMLLLGSPVLAQESSVAVNPQIADAGAACAVGAPKLNISDDQRLKLSALHDQFELSTATKKAELDVSKRQLRRLLGAATIDKGAAVALQNKINGLRADLSNARLSMMLSASDVFTPEQRAQFAEMRKHGGWHHGHHHGGFGGHGGFGHGEHGGPRAFGAEGPQAPGAGAPPALGAGPAPDSNG